MNLIIPHAYNVPGGVEKVTCSLIKEFSKLIDKVIFVLPENKIDYFKKIIPPSDKLIYETFSWPRGSWQNRVYLNLSKILAVMEKYGCAKSLLYKKLYEKKERLKKDDIIKYLAKKHKATHCLYMIINAQRVPSLKIPVAGIVHDVFWLTFPDCYSEEFKKERQENLIEWLTKADVVFAVSNRTKKDILSIYSKNQSKVQVIPEAADINKKNFSKTNKQKIPILYYPAGLNDHKHHLILFKAAYKLAQKKLKFKLLLTGKDTEYLTGNRPIKSMIEEQARIFYQKNKKLMSKYVKSLGYCDNEKVDALYKKCSAVVLASVYEGFGLPLAEALARGIPVICSDIDVFEEQIELYKCKDFVTTFPAGNVDALTGCCAEFLKHPKKRLSYEAVKRRFSHWTWKEVAEKYINCLRTCKPVFANQKA
jgi:glycosyltransferase involved in cell wall biosynthesis